MQRAGPFRKSKQHSCKLVLRIARSKVCSDIIYDLKLCLEVAPVGAQPWKTITNFPTNCFVDPWIILSNSLLVQSHSLPRKLRIKISAAIFHFSDSESIAHFGLVALISKVLTSCDLLLRELRSLVLALSEILPTSWLFPDVNSMWCFSTIMHFEWPPHIISYCPLSLEAICVLFLKYGLLWFSLSSLSPFVWHLKLYSWCSFWLVSENRPSLNKLQPINSVLRSDPILRNSTHTFSRSPSPTAFHICKLCVTGCFEKAVTKVQGKCSHRPQGPFFQRTLIACSGPQISVLLLRAQPTPEHCPNYCGIPRGWIIYLLCSTNALVHVHCSTKTLSDSKLKIPNWKENCRLLMLSICKIMLQEWIHCFAALFSPCDS